MIFRKASAADVSAVEEIYNDIHTEEENGKLTIGWIRGIYPTRATAEGALEWNSVARAMYRKLGYAEVGIVDTELQGLSNVSMVLLEKYLG